MPLLLLIRHGLNDHTGKRLIGRRPGIHLNAAGLAQAGALAEALAQAPLKAIYTSPLERCVETAQPLAERLGLPLQRHPGLLEVDFGGWVGKTGKQMRRMKLWKTVQERPSEARFPNGESFAEAQARVCAALTEIAAGLEEHDLVACFSHSDLIKLAIAAYLGLPLDNFQRLPVDTASITAVALSKEAPPHFLLINQRLPGEIQWKPPEKRKK